MLLVTATLALVPNLPMAAPTTSLPTPADPGSTEILAPSFLLAPTAPPAPLLGGSSPISYTYVEVNYIYTDLNNVPGTQNGVEGVVSWNVLLGIYLEGSYATSNGDTDVDRSRIGAGYHLPLGEKLDVFGFVNYEHEHFSGGGSTSNGDGYEFDLGGRFMLLESLEVNAQAEWNHVHDDNFGAKFGGRYYFTGPFSVGATVETIDSSVRFAGGVRFQF